jgi:hypothetical protein
MGSRSLQSSTHCSLPLLSQLSTRFVHSSLGQRCVGHPGGRHPKSNLQEDSGPCPFACTIVKGDPNLPGCWLGLHHLRVANLYQELELAIHELDFPALQPAFITCSRADALNLFLISQLLNCQCLGAAHSVFST